MRVQTRRRAGRVIGSALAAVLAMAVPARAQTFYPDDPLVREPPPVPVVDPLTRNLSLLLEAASATFGDPGERHPPGGVIAARGVNTLGEVMDGPWFVNRHGRTRLTTQELRRGAGAEHPPSMDGPWNVLLVKGQGVRQGIVIRDVRNQIFLLRFDAPGSPELATGAEMVSSRFFHALGYHVPETYLVVFERERLVPESGGSDISSMGTLRDLLPEDIDRLLALADRRSDGSYRAVALRVPIDAEALLGPFQFFGTRSDDPNDVVAHEHRRDLRGLFVFSAWLNHTRVGPLYTVDTLLSDESDGAYIQHHLVDFMSTLGSGRSGPKQAYEGWETVYAQDSTVKNIAGFGVWGPHWTRASFSNLPSVGRFESDQFDPERWTPLYGLAPFDNRLPDDTFWAARQVMAFTDDDIAAIVDVGQYSDPAAAAWITRCLIERRDRIGRTYFSRVLPIDRFVVRNGELVFDDLAVVHGFAEPRAYAVGWSSFDNETGTHTPILDPARGAQMPPIVRDAQDGDYVAARLTADGEDPGKAVVVYLRQERDGLRVVGVDREWPGRRLVDPRTIEAPLRNRYAELEPRQRTLFDEYAKQYNERTGQSLTPQEYFQSLDLSEQTTFDAVTHALTKSTLTDEQGTLLGHAIDLVSRVERIAGQYAGRSGDQQFRLYVDMVPETRDLLERSREFVQGHENTVYHVGYPHSYRQAPGVPSMQISLSEDGLRADIDVDYRTSKVPQSLFNGHLTSSNSDVRAGDNAQRHDRKWSGFAAWWEAVFGHLRFRGEAEEVADPLELIPLREPTPLPPNRPAGASIPDVADASQEFLTDWLVRRNYQEALAFFADDAFRCLADQPGARPGAGPDELRPLALDLLTQAAESWGRVTNLNEAMSPVLPWHPSVRVESHPFERDFTIVELPDERGAQFECGVTPTTTFEPTRELRYGTYFATILRVVASRREQGVLGLLWRRVDGEWRIIAYHTFEQ